MFAKLRGNQDPFPRIKLGASKYMKDIYNLKVYGPSRLNISPRFVQKLSTCVSDSLYTNQIELKLPATIVRKNSKKLTSDAHSLVNIPECFDIIECKN